MARSVGMSTIIGTAGWSIATAHANRFPSEGTALERYSKVFSGVEVNSSFYRPHRSSTWERWAEAVPPDFRFAVKIPRTITHDAKLVDADALTKQVVANVTQLREKLGALLVQLPPSLAFESSTAERFFAQLQGTIDIAVVCEPRHSSWFTDEADALLSALQVARVAADPALVPAAAQPGGWRGLAYWRLHGSPAMYRSAYSDDALDRYAALIERSAQDAETVWCMFDNTAASAATLGALTLMTKM